LERETVEEMVLVKGVGWVETLGVVWAVLWATVREHKLEGG
jgi:hypothetical protein